MKHLVLCMFLFTTSMLFAQETALGLDNEVSNAPEVKKKLTRRQYKKTFRYRFFKHHEELITEYHERQKAVAKRDEKWERLSKKPQYSDPSYFGHKKKPKIHKKSKRKLCEECGIIH